MDTYTLTETDKPVFTTTGMLPEAVLQHARIAGTKTNVRLRTHTAHVQVTAWIHKVLLASCWLPRNTIKGCESSGVTITLSPVTKLLMPDPATFGTLCQNFKLPTENKSSYLIKIYMHEMYCKGV